MVMGNNNKESIASLSEVLSSQNLIADVERKDDATTIDSQTNYNSIHLFSEVSNNPNLITGVETKEDKTTTGIQIDCNRVDFLEDSLTHCNSPIFEEETKYTAAQNTKTNNNNIESLIVGISTDVGKQAQTTQNKKRRQNKDKKSKGNW